MSTECSGRKIIPELLPVLCGWLVEYLLILSEMDFLLCAHAKLASLEKGSGYHIYFMPRGQANLLAP